MKTPITGNDIKALGFPEGKTIGIALKINSKRNGFTRERKAYKRMKIKKRKRTCKDNRR